MLQDVGNRLILRMTVSAEPLQPGEAPPTEESMSAKAGRFHPAVVAAVRMITPSVRHVTLQISPASTPAPLSFRPGQWLDLAAPGLADLGGFSVCSTPARLAADGCLEIAVRRSPGSAPARWVHEACQPGDEIQLRVGGRCVVEPADSDRPLLLVAGGIGVSPLMSIFLQRAEEASRSSSTTSSPPPTLLLHSARSVEELAFSDVVAAKCRKWPSLQARWFVTGPSELSGQYETGRIRSDYLRQLVAKQQMPAHNWLAFVCGPPGMAEDLSEALVAAGLPPDSVRREDWSLGGADG